MADLLNDTEIQERASQLSGWTVQGRQLRCTRLFKDFIGAIAFVNKLVAPSEAAGHHPDIEISYNKVTVNLTEEMGHKPRRPTAAFRYPNHSSRILNK
ncbi:MULTISPECIES: 4a-hydroxytetrahydrobiopterin dehydratase [unclassified Microcoleus]|uniref:4a-hydroxytetrahydrobiopterin dehydratase n=1 Tax=unclassified Microcoleus TaxID=2642155 RepID=UPI0025DD66DC|nr:MULTISPECIES: 4a-hydroxytetrahydrobiopterin dehydratase [unclassified Microcoleus]